MIFSYFPSVEIRSKCSESLLSKNITGRHHWLVKPPPSNNLKWIPYIFLLLKDNDSVFRSCVNCGKVSLTIFSSFNLESYVMQCWCCDVFAQCLHSLKKKKRYFFYCFFYKYELWNKMGVACSVTKATSTPSKT